MIRSAHRPRLAKKRREYVEHDPHHDVTRRAVASRVRSSSRARQRQVRLRRADRIVDLPVGLPSTPAEQSALRSRTPSACARRWPPLQLNLAESMSPCCGRRIGAWTTPPVKNVDPLRRSGPPAHIFVNLGKPGSRLHARARLPTSHPGDRGMTLASAGRTRCFAGPPSAARRAPAAVITSAMASTTTAGSMPVCDERLAFSTRNGSAWKASQKYSASPRALPIPATKAQCPNPRQRQMPAFAILPNSSR